MIRVLTSACLAVSAVMGAPVGAQDLIETCRITQSCQHRAPCRAGDGHIGIETTWTQQIDTVYDIIIDGERVADPRDHEGHVFTWLTGEDDGQRSFALSYIYNSQMPDPDVAEFVMIETLIQGRLTDTIVHSGFCRESEK